MSHHHFLPWLISRAWHLGRYAHFLCESAARVVQVGLCHGQRAVRFPRQRHLIASSPYEGSENQNRLNRPKRASRHIRREVIAPGRRSIPRRDNGFMITCPARSGSSMLVHLLRSHPEICAHDEVFSPDKVRGLSGKYLQRSREDPGFIEWLSAERYRDPIRFLYKFVLDPDGKKAVGFKLKHDELVLPGYETMRNEIVSNRKLRIVHLRRNNLLRRYLSHYLAMHVTRVTFAVGAMPIPEVARIRLDPRECEKNFETILAREAEFAGLFAQHRGFHISYEDLVNGQSRKLNALLEFLGVPPRQLTTTTGKLGRDDLRQAIANFDELREYFSGTRFAEFFEAE